ncbi:hypothetical protein SeMB42_g05654 [Synchytrium endobioticum]|uniref:Nitrogen regulatory protein areA GATA-like domain-containing protein n=1 Tax=Synchytrium endobioticum TaxID=286115 RepID=A0A507CQ92_9FUNG|nr:hypothetical protein SeMB42_g05654 [Synchytrium endobioticum]
MAPIATVQDAPTNVDYLSYEFNQFDLHSCWKFNTKHKHSIINGRRLENASWRKFFQMKFNLKTADPSSLNWQKDNDVCWLYGPFFSYEPLPVIEAAALEQDRAERAGMPGTKDMDIGYGYGHHAVANSATYTASVAASTNNNNNTSLRSALKKRKDKDDVWQALRERYIANGGNLRPEDLQAFSSRDPSPPAPTGRGALFYLSDFPIRHVNNREGIPRVTSETWSSAKWDRRYDWDDNSTSTNDSSSNNTPRRTNAAITEELSPSTDDETSPTRGRSLRSKSPKLGSDSPDTTDVWNKHIRFADNVQVRIEEEDAEEEEPESVNEDDYSSSPAETGAWSGLYNNETNSAVSSPLTPGIPSKVNVVALKKPDLSESETDDEPDYFVAKSRNSRNDSSSNMGQRSSSPSNKSIASITNNSSSIESSKASSNINYFDYNSTPSNYNSINITTENITSIQNPSTSPSSSMTSPTSTQLPTSIFTAIATPPCSLNEATLRGISTVHTAEESDDDGIVYVNVRKSPNLSHLHLPSVTPAGPAIPAAMKYANSSGSLGGLKRTTSTGKLSLALQQATQVQQERLASAPANYASISFDSFLPAPGSTMSPATCSGQPGTPPFEVPVDPLLFQQLKHSPEQAGHEPYHALGGSSSSSSAPGNRTLPSPPPSASASASENVLLLGTLPLETRTTQGESDSYVAAAAPEPYTVNDRVNDVFNNAYEVIRWAGTALSNLGIF